jgi:hypothetical protein
VGEEKTGGKRCFLIRLRLPPNCGGIGYKESHVREAEEVRR